MPTTLDFYCISCGKKHENETIIDIVKNKIGRFSAIGECPKTGKALWQFVKEEKAKSIAKQLGKKEIGKKK